MIVSEARREANRRNAAKSTGPRTAEGKDRSRRNALDHGLAAEVVHLPEDDGPGEAPDRGTTAFDLWLAAEIALTTRRLDRSRRSEERLRREAVLRAKNHWDDDRRSDAEALGATLEKSPALVVDRLKQTPSGCDWLIERWTLLSRVAEITSPADDLPDVTAFNLLGTPPSLRGSRPGEVIDPTGRTRPRVDALAIVARREIQALEARKIQVAEVDAFAREIAIDDLRDEPTPELKRLRRYESRLHRRLAWCLEQLPEGADAHHALPEPVPAPVPVPESVPVEVVIPAEPDVEAPEVAPARARRLGPDPRPVEIAVGNPVGQNEATFRRVGGGSGAGPRRVLG